MNYRKMPPSDNFSYFTADKLKSVHFAIPLLCAAVYILNALFVLLFKTVEADAITAYTLMAIAEILAVGLPAAVYQKFKEEKTEHVGFSPDKISVIILASAAMTFGAMAIGMFFDHLGLVENSGATYNTLRLPELENRLAPMLYATVTFAAVPALCEEFLCRHVIYKEYEKYGNIAAITVSAVSFALMHFSLGKLPMYLFCGFLLGLLRMITNSSIATFFAHFFYNAFALFYYKFFGALSEQLSEFTLVFFLLLFLFLLCFSLMMGESARLFRSYHTKSKLALFTLEKTETKSTRQGLFLYISSPALWLSFVLYVIFSLIL